MIFEAFYSSSQGNLYLITASNGRRLLVECGVTWKKLQKALKYDLTGIDGCLISHSHNDHSKCAEDVLQAGMDLYASEGTLRGIEDSLHLHRRAHILPECKPVKIGEAFEVFSFPVHHDAAEPRGFIVHDRSSKPEENLLFVTDTSHVTQRFGIAFDIIAISASYDKDVLAGRVERQEIDETLAKRLLVSHMEYHVTKRYLKQFCNLARCRQIYMLHASRDNIDAKQVREEIEKELFVKTVIA